MSMKTNLPVVVALTVFICVSSLVGQQPTTGAETETAAEIKAKADYNAAEKEAKTAEDALGPVRDAMQKADVAYANARKVANAKRQQATNAKNLAGEQGIKYLKQAESNLPAAIKALADATDAKPPLDQALLPHGLR